MSAPTRTEARRRRVGNQTHKRVPTPDSLEVVRRVFEGYAKRGIFRAYGDKGTRNSRNDFSFVWHTDATFHVVYDRRRRRLTFKDLLPNIPARSSMYRELKAFLHSKTSRTLPEHRRVDPRKAAISTLDRRGRVSITVTLTDRHLEYGVRKAVNLIHELFFEFLRYPLYFDYMVENFNLNPDA